MSNVKICRTCKQEKDFFSFHKDVRKSDGFRNQCKNCTSKRSKYLSLQKEDVFTLNKECRRCKIIKLNKEFSKQKRSSDGLSSYCKLCVNMCKNKEISKRWILNNPDKIKVYKEKHSNIQRIRSEKRRTQLKQEVMNAYGNMCRCCGESDIWFLNIDHINNDGWKHRKEITGQFYTWLKINNFPKDNFQILCYNCNMAKKVRGYCPHQKSFHTNEILAGV